MRKVRLWVAAVIAALGLAGMSAGPAVADSAPRWDAYYYAPSGAALYVQSTGTSASFPFRTAPGYVARMTTNDASLTGDKLGETVTATVGVTGLTGDWTYNGEETSWNPGGAPANVRLFFTSYSSAAGIPGAPSQAGGSGYPGVVYTEYWWSNPESVTMTQISKGEWQLTATLSPDQWSDWDGQLGNSSAGVAAAFDGAASHIASIGVSFGGGNYFENGVATSDGSGQFQLSGFSD